MCTAHVVAEKMLFECFFEGHIFLILFIFREFT